MCFSAGASFGACALLSVAGAGAMVKARTVPQGLFASIPFIFSIQQLAEGMLWLSLKNSELAAGQPFFTYAFLVFAMMLWPVFIPLVIRMLEKDERRKRMMNLLLAIGVLISTGVGVILLLCPVQVVATHHHLHYMFDFPPEIPKFLLGPFSILYFMATIVPPFISTIKRMKWLGIIFAASYLFAVIFFGGFVVSVWCYFAAVMSLVVIWILAGLQRPLKQVKPSLY